MGNHPWKVEVTQGDSNVTESVIDSWFSEVYEPVFDSEEGTNPEPMGRTNPEPTEVTEVVIVKPDNQSDVSDDIEG
jgi:hypothetical protein